MRRKQTNKIQYRLAKVQDFENGRLTYWYKSPLCKSFEERRLDGLQYLYDLLDHYRNDDERLEKAKYIKKVQLENISRLIRNTNSIWVKNQQ